MKLWFMVLWNPFLVLLIYISGILTTHISQYLYCLYLSRIGQTRLISCISNGHDLRDLNPRGVGVASVFTLRNIGTIFLRCKVLGVERCAEMKSIASILMKKWF